MSNMSENALACFGQLNRDNRYMLITKIVETPEGLTVRKTAYSDMGNMHIQSILDNHAILTKKLAKMKKVRVAKARRINEGCVEFEYIRGKNLDTLTNQAIIEGDYKKAITIIDSVFKLVDSLSSEMKSEATGLAKEINKFYSSQKKFNNYMNPGVIDLNLDNFLLESDGVLVAFDCEWLVREPLSASFIKTRILHTFFARRSDGFTFLPNKEKPFMVINEQHSRTLVPKYIYDRYSNYLSVDSLSRYLRAEDIFQTYVKSNHRSKSEGSYSLISVSETAEAQKTLPSKFESIQADLLSSNTTIEILRAENETIKSSIHSIQSSRMYRLMSSIRASLPFRLLLKIRSLF